MAKSKNNNDLAKVMDVAKPGKTAPDASARPLIITHQPMVKDPMMSEPKPAATDLEPKEAEAKPPSRTGMTIQPTAVVVTDEKKAVTPETLPTVPDNQLSPPEPEKPETADQPSPEPAESTPPSDETKPEEPKPAVDSTGSPPESAEADATASDDAAVVDAVAGETGAKKTPGEPTDEEKAKTAATEQLIASKQYFVPISHAKSRGVSHIITLAMVAILLLAVAAELAIDAEVLDIGIPPVIDLIKN